MNANTIAGLVAVSLALGLASPAVAAQGVWMGPQALKPAARAALSQAVAQEKARNPQAFEAVAQVTGCTLAGYSQMRQNAPSCGRQLRALQGQVVLPLLSALALSEPRGADGHVPYATAAEREAFAAAAIEAVGILRDVRARDVLHAAFATAPSAVLARSAADALGRLGGDAELAILEGNARSGAKQLAAIGGLGECKRVDAAKVLGSLLATSKDPVLTTAIANAAGRVASAWAWQAIVRSVPSKAAESLDIRTLMARAVAEALLVTTEAGAVEELTQALQMTEHPQMAAILAEVRARGDKAAMTRVDTAASRYVAYSKQR